MGGMAEDFGTIIKKCGESGERNSIQMKNEIIRLPIGIL